MAENSPGKPGKPLIPVDPIKLEVLGGTFIVRGVFGAPGRDAAAGLGFIRSTPSERWFVILAEGEENSEDILALIDDEFEFQSIAAGSLEKP